MNTVANVLFNPQITGASASRGTLFDAISVLQSQELGEAEALALLLEAAGDDDIVLTETASRLKEYQGLLRQIVQYRDPLLDDIVALVDRAARASSGYSDFERGAALFSHPLVKEERTLVAKGIPNGFRELSRMEPRLLQLEDLASSNDWRTAVMNDLLGGTPPEEHNRLLRLLLSHAERRHPEAVEARRREGASERLRAAISLRLRTLVGPWAHANPAVLETFVAEAVARLYLAAVAN